MTGLPLATPRDVRRWAVTTVRGRKKEFGLVLGLFCLATTIGLARPQLLGAMVDGIDGGTTVATIDLLAGMFVTVLLLQALARGAARVRCRLFSEAVLADTRERFVANALRLSLETAETAGTGDLLSRATKDVSRLNQAIRHAVPELLIAVITVLLTAVAMVVTAPLLSLALLVPVPLLVAANRWYQRRVPDAVLGALGSWAAVQAAVHETVVGARTAEALSLNQRRQAATDALLHEAVRREQLFRRLRLTWLLSLDVCYLLPIAVMLPLGGLAYGLGWAGLGTIATVLAYQQAMITPLNDALLWLQELQVAAAALRRVLGVHPRPAAARTTPVAAKSPAGKEITVTGVRFGYRDGHEVLHGIDLTIPCGQRLAIVGPSGAGKSTLGRLLAGIATPTAGSVAIGGAEISHLPEDVRRGEVLLLTQEHHVFAGTLRDNLALPAQPAGGDWTDAEILDALAAVGAREWAAALPDGLDTPLGSGGHPVPAAKAQQMALARVVLADPHTLVLDEATSLLDATSARELERSLTRVLAGRTVIAIAHRLHTAAVSHRVAVLVNGRIAELGSHTELLTAGGPYAQLVCTAS
ncbi:ABC transporter ATP-binding protein [Streptoalloteichus hindustanus]|uniref:ABC-type multidrug transport system, ATPase and permease component n=1 Tax=Streptoalloteichus hindustanus TaxID=2017 RepID=A0A1M5CV03_STRHI|nr:ABC transporter ATP-binding protein [Streptoalloteichus hindustanus]SHF58601.1 ABC-type multidrug transport system, ATPase and permease component [Streptoalloteichus hindustanus]